MFVKSTSIHYQEKTFFDISKRAKIFQVLDNECMNVMSCNAKILPYDISKKRWLLFYVEERAQLFSNVHKTIT